MCARRTAATTALTIPPPTKTARRCWPRRHSVRKASMTNKRNDTSATSITWFSGLMRPFASANGSPHGVCTIRSPDISLKTGLKGEKPSTIRTSVQRTVTTAVRESRPVPKYFRTYQANETTRSAIGTKEIRSAIAYAPTVVAFIIPNSARAFPAAPKAVNAKNKWATCELLWDQIARWMSANVKQTAAPIDQRIVIQLIGRDDAA